MKKFALILAITMATISIPTAAQADWFGGGNNGEWVQGPYGPYWEESDWPEWTPMYWMEEFMDGFGNNNWGGNNWGSNNWGGNNWGNNNGGYGMPYGNNIPYGYNVPYGYTYPQYPAVPTIPAQ